MQPECFVELHHQVVRNFTENGTKSVDRNGAHLLSLGLGVHGQPGDTRGKENLKWVDPSDVRCDWHHSDDALPASFSRTIRSIVADDYCRTLLICLTAPRRIQVH